MLTEEQKLYRYCNCKKQDTKRGKPAFLLTEDQVKQLLNEAGITIFDVGRRSDEYQLARYGDTGDYVMGNCRFITRRENLAEQDHYKQWSAPGNEERRKKTGIQGAENWRKFVKENPEKASEIGRRGGIASAIRNS